MYLAPACLNSHQKILFVKKTQKLILALIRRFSHFNNSFGLWDAPSNPTYKCGSLQRLQSFYMHIKSAVTDLFHHGYLQVSWGQHSSLPGGVSHLCVSQVITRVTTLGRLSSSGNRFWGFGKATRLVFVTLELTINEGLFCVWGFGRSDDVYHSETCPCCFLCPHWNQQFFSLVFVCFFFI